MNRDTDRQLKNTRFWERKSLEEMTRGEWESLCDGCGKCCLCKIEDEDMGKVYYTNVSCKLLDTRLCRCLSYENRRSLVPGCAILTPENVRKFHWLPATCAYRRLAEGKDLYKWHRLISGDPELVHKLGISVKNKVVSEHYIHPDQMPEHIVDWK
ncbi:MAG: YcgN family cysteine cluster protein [bacterium]|nr:YcgN family cysteine cluster protein [bacterium]